MIRNKQLVWHTSKKKIDDLLPYKKNPRIMTEEQITNLKKSINRFNLVEIPAVDTNNRIIAGHQRLKVLQLLGRGDEYVDVRVPNRPLTEKEYEQYLLTSNAITGDWDFEALQDFDADMLMDIGFDMGELNSIWSSTLEAEDDDFNTQKELQKIKTPVTQEGDIIILGNNRLICGDSNNPDVLKKLCGKDKVSTVLSDPVYNLSINYDAGLGGKRNFGGNVNDTRSEEEYIEVLRQNIKTALTVTKPDCHFFYFNTEEQIWILQTLYKECGIRNRRVCMWIKNAHNETPNVAFSKVYEPCIYGTVGKPTLSKKETGLNEILNQDIGTGNDSLDDINIWTAKRVSGKKMNHATEKPVTLYHKPIRRCTKVGDIILDSFGGSGSTLIAAEQLKRRAFLVEKEPLFCDLIIKRFEALTGIKAKILR